MEVMLLIVLFAGYIWGQKVESDIAHFSVNLNVNQSFLVWLK